MREKTLDVYYKGHLVGTMEETHDQLIAFQYSDDWIKNGFAISPFSLPLESRVFLPEPESRKNFNGLFGVFADSLPDSWGELLLDKYLQSIDISRDSISTLDRLAYVGNSGMGALEYYPSKTKDYSFDGLDYDSIAKECQIILSSKTPDQLNLLYKLGGSSGGSRPKILLKENEEEWIIKFPMREDDKNSGKKEYDYSLCAKKCGIKMTDTQLIPSKLCEGYFKTKRFDREKGEKILSITFAGLLEVDFRAPSCDYDHFMKLVNVLTYEDKQQIEQMFRIMCFNVFSHNLDDHTKNFSFLRKNNRWQLAPAYDLTYSNTYYGEHTTSVNGKGKGIQENDLLCVGIKAGLKMNQCKDIIKEIKNNIKILDQYLGKQQKNQLGQININEKIKEVSDNSKQSQKKNQNNKRKNQNKNKNDGVI